MMKKWKNKLKSRAGESLSETLIALLVAALALAMLAGAMATASGLVTRSKEKLEGADGYYTNMEALVSMESGTSGKVIIKGANLDDDPEEAGNNGIKIDIVYKKNATFGNIPVVAYKKN